MFHRKLALPDRSFFLLGPRQTGKSTWLKSLDLPSVWLVNLLENDTYFRYLRDPAQFRREALEKIRQGSSWIILDEIQRIPALLDEVHGLIETSACRFILSGSSARKLKRTGANLLGGRAMRRFMHPFTAAELGESFDLEHALRFGTLPPLHGLAAPDSIQVLRAYVDLYLREEIQLEGLVRNLGGFTRFLDYAAAYCGEVANYSSLAKEAGLPIKTVQSYFEVLEDTLVALRVPAWTKSPLKRLVSHPKYYLFDNGVRNALTHNLKSQPDPVLKGRLFEQFFIQETRRVLDLAGKDFALFFWRTNNGAEVDLLIQIDGQLYAAVEFKSRPSLSGADCSGLRSFHEDNPHVPCWLVCTAPQPFRLDFVEVLPWQDYLQRLDP